MNEFSAYVGLDAHKATIAVAVALPGRQEPVYRGEIKNQPRSVLRLVARVNTDGEPVSYCDEAGPCGRRARPWRAAVGCGTDAGSGEGAGAEDRGS